MKKLFLGFGVLAIAAGFLVNASGCSGGGCDVDIHDFLNGKNSSDAESYWSCNATGLGSFSFSIYENGTGKIGGSSFTWKQTGCGTLEYETFAGKETVSNISGTAATKLSFVSKSDGGQMVEVICSLKQEGEGGAWGTYDADPNDSDADGILNANDNCPYDPLCS